MKNVKKEFIRRFVVKQAITYRKQTSELVSAVEAEFGKRYSKRTIQRWMNKSMAGWDYHDKSTRPATIHKRVTPELEEWVVGYRQRTDYDARSISQVLLKHKGASLSGSTIKRIIEKHSLSRGSKMKGKKLKWVRWERDTPNSLWQMDHTDEPDGTLRLVVEDDCSRFCLGILRRKSLTTHVITEFLDAVIAVYGKPRQILTDHGAVYQKQFDKWCRYRGIEHIRSRVNKPTTCGKVERLHWTYEWEIHKFHNAEEFRWSYNTQRPHESLDFKTPTEVYNEFYRLLFYKPQSSKE